MPGTGLDARQLMTFVVEPVLKYLDPEVPDSLAARRLVLGTALHESDGLRYIDQLSTDPSRPGPAYGLWQMERATLNDHLAWLRIQPNAALRSKIEGLMSAWPPQRELQLHGNLNLACALCRIHYRRRPEALPAADDTMGFARLYKVAYNTMAGAATIEQAAAAMRLALQCA